MVLPVRRSSASCRECPTSNPSCASPCISIKSPGGVLCFAGLNPRSLSQNLRTFTKIAVTYLAQYLEMLYLRHRLKSLLPRAKVHRDGAMAYDPDTAPSAPMSEED